jgi:hypothetical protein
MQTDINLRLTLSNSLISSKPILGNSSLANVLSRRSVSSVPLFLVWYTSLARILDSSSPVRSRGWGSGHSSEDSDSPRAELDEAEAREGSENGRGKGSARTREETDRGRMMIDRPTSARDIGRRERSMAAG